MRLDRVKRRKMRWDVLAQRVLAAKAAVAQQGRDHVVPGADGHGVVFPPDQRRKGADLIVKRVGVLHEIGVGGGLL